MIIRKLNNDDVFQHERVASQSFIYDCDVDSPENELPCEYMLGAFCDDSKTLMADMEIEKRNSFFDGNMLTCLAIGGVASKPEFRNKGAVREIFNTLFNDDSLNLGADISILYPFSSYYYRKFGYESVGRAVEMTVPFSEFRNIPRCSDVFLYEEQDNNSFFELYNNSAKRYNLAFERNESRFFTFEPYKTMLYTYVLNDYSAYVSFSVNREKETVFVKEIQYLNKESLLKIIGFLRSFEGNQKYVSFSKLSENSPVLNLPADEKKVKMKLYSVGAARVLDAESVLLKRNYPNLNGSFSLKINDSINKNNKIFNLEIANGKCRIEKSEKGNTDVVLEANEASRILLSGIRDRDMFIYSDGIQINNNSSLFFEAFSFRNCFINDEF